MKKKIDKKTTKENSTEKEIKKILAKVRPSLQADGGDVEFVGFKKGIVEVKLLGSCGHCMMSTYTLKLGIEHALKEKIKSVKEVVAV